MNISLKTIKTQSTPTKHLSRSHRDTKKKPSHALCIKLKDRSEAEMIIRRFSELAGSFGATPIKLRVDHLPVKSDSLAAENRRRQELTIEIEPNDPSGLRASLLFYANSAVDFCLVAKREFIRRDALFRFAHELRASDNAVFSSLQPVVATLPAGFTEENSQPTFGWGFPDALTIHNVQHHIKGSSLPMQVSPDLLTAALGYTLLRFESQTWLRLGMIGQPHLAGALPDGLSWVDLHLIEENNVLDFVNQIGRQLKNPDHALPWNVLTEFNAGLVWDDRTMDGDQLEYEYFPYLAPPFKLTITAHCSQTEYSFSYTFDSNLCSPTMIENFDQVFINILQQFTSIVARKQEQKLANINLLSKEKAVEVIALSQSGILPSTYQATRIDDLIENFVKLQPDAPAISFEDHHLNYGELGSITDRIASILWELGVRPGTRVGILMERSLELVPTLLATLKVGAAYLPIDPAYPKERIAFTLDDAQPALIISSGEVFESMAGRNSISVEELWKRANTITKCSSLPERKVDDTAYIIYTSGSTGRPKGVAIPHANVSALIAATQNDFALSVKDVWTLFHSTAFDFSVWEIWACLGTGGHLIVVPYWVSRDPIAFSGLLQRECVTVLNQTPSAFSQLQETVLRQNLSLALRLVIFGGEPLNCKGLTSWFDRYPESSCRLVNMFGITETTVHVTAETITRHHALTHSRSVGPAIPGWTAYVLDHLQKLLPAGIPGEIYVGGAGVALEYLHRPDLTEHRFLPNPFHTGKMYRSGDSGCLRPDGGLEHHGRLDSQIKIRGFRIELDEIHAVLLECPGVQATAVVVNRSDPDDAASARIDAYVVGQVQDSATVRRHAARSLPDHMVPATVTILSVLPLTTNGKLDAKQLPPPLIIPTRSTQTTSTVSTQAVFKESTAAENLLQIMQDIFSEIMGIIVEPDDNFFDIGGNSLYAVRITVALQAKANINLPMRNFYLFQTIRAITESMESTSSSEGVMA